jgi:hypothetical protein
MKKTVCKVRGITLNYSVSQFVKFDVIRGMILTWEQESVTVHTDKNFKRKKKGGVLSLITEPEDKRYGISFF